MILGTIATRDIITWFIMLLICAFFFLIMGIMLVVTKKVSLISKKAHFKNEKQLCLLYGIIEIVVSLILTAISIVGIILTNIYLPLFIAAFLLLVGLLLSILLIQKHYTI